MADRIIQPLPPEAWLITDGASYGFDAQNRSFLVFPASTAASLYTPEFHVPPSLTTPLKVRVTFRMASATSGSINLSVAVEVLADADNFDTDAGSSFDTANASGAISVPATTAGRTKTFDITLTNNDGIALDEYYRLALTRSSEAGEMHILAMSLLDDGG